MLKDNWEHSMCTTFKNLRYKKRNQVNMIRNIKEVNQKRKSFKFEILIYTINKNINK